MILQAEHFSNIEQTKNMIMDRDQQLRNDRRTSNITITCTKRYSYKRRSI